MEWKAEPTSTRISVPATSEILKSRKGFSFLELMVVIALAALLAGYAVPNFTALFTSPQEKEYQHLTKVLRMLRTDALLRSQAYCLSFDLKEQKLMPGLIGPEGCGDGENQEEDWPKWLKEHEFLEEFALQDARYSSNTQSQNPSANFEVLIDNSGFVTPFLLTFLEADGQRFWEMESVGILGKLELRESK